MNGPTSATAASAKEYENYWNWAGFGKPGDDDWYDSDGGRNRLTDGCYGAPIPRAVVRKLKFYDSKVEVYCEDGTVYEYVRDHGFLNALCRDCVAGDVVIIQSECEEGMMDRDFLWRKDEPLPVYVKGFWKAGGEVSYSLLLLKLI